MCNEVVHIEPYVLEFILERFETQGLCTLWYVPDNLKTHKMFIKAAEKHL